MQMFQGQCAKANVPSASYLPLPIGFNVGGVAKPSASYSRSLFGGPSCVIRCVAMLLLTQPFFVRRPCGQNLPKNMQTNTYLAGNTVIVCMVFLYLAIIDIQ